MSDSVAYGGSYEESLTPSPQYDAPTDLIQRCLDGEERAFSAVYNEYATMIYRLCYSLLRHEQDAEEVLQDTFDYAFRKLSRYDASRASFKTWLFQIAISRCRNKRRRKWLPTFPLGHIAVEVVPDSGTATPDDSALRTEKQDLVWEAIGRLSDKLREVAVLRYREEMTYNEIGAVLSIPPKTAESRMRLAHNQLKSILLADRRWTE